MEDYLDAFDGIVIAVSHDRYFLDRIVHRIFALEGDGHIQQYEGGYGDYLIARAKRYPNRYLPDGSIRGNEKSGQGEARTAEKKETEGKDIRKTFRLCYNSNIGVIQK